MRQVGMGRGWWMWLLAMLAFVAGLSGCGTRGTLPPAPASATPQAGQAGQAYKIAPLEGLQVVVWQHPDLSGRFTVRPDGRISMPLAEDIQAAGRQPEELARDIEQKLARYIQAPKVTVISTGTSGTSAAQVRVVGEAAQPQGVPCHQNMTLLDVMIRVGGLTDYADGNAAVLVRAAQNGAQSGTQYRLRLKDLLKRGDISANVEVLPGDIIIVPESLF